VEEAKKRSEEAKAQLEAAKRRLIEERELAKQELEQRLRSIEFTRIWHEEPEVKEDPEVIAQREKEKKKQDEKERKKAKKQEKKLLKKNELEAGEIEKKKMRKQHKKEEEERLRQREEQEIKRKELARKGYTERHERKRTKIIKGGAELSPTTMMDDRKLFIGGFMWKDLERKKLKPEQEAKVKAERIKNFFHLIEQFGPVIKTKDHILSKQHAFVTFQDVRSLEKALEALSKFEDRERISKEIKQKLIEERGKEAGLHAPSPHYYVRRVNAVTHKVPKTIKQSELFPVLKGINEERDTKKWSSYPKSIISQVQ